MTYIMEIDFTNQSPDPITPATGQHARRPKERNPMKTFVFAALVAIPSVASAAPWNVDSAHSSARFSVRHMMVSDVHGKMGNIAGTIDWDEKDATKSKVDVTVDVNGIDTGDAKRDEHLKAADFFDAATHPTIKFVSKKVKKKGKQLEVTGDLTMRGVTKEVVLMVSLPGQVVKDPWGNWRTGATATTKVNRKDFGMSFSQTMDGGGLMVGDDVQITIDLEFVTKERSA
jgi:polyisoprenoid-binding protein YceI